MSFAGKENLIFFEKLEKLQTQLFDDACDMGVEITDKPVHKSRARKNLMALMENYAYTLNKYEAGSVTDIFIPFEFDEGAYVGVTLNVDFCKAKGREYLMIDIRRTRKTHAEIEGKLFKIPKNIDVTQEDLDREAGISAHTDAAYTNAWVGAAHDSKRFN